MKLHRIAFAVVVATAVSLFMASVAHDARAQVLRASVDSAGAQSDGDSERQALSADGRFVVFSSLADDLVLNDTNGRFDVFVHDRITQITERVSVSSAGVEANSDSGQYGVAISADGRVVAFSSNASNLVANDMNGASDIFVHDRGTGVTECVSVDPAGVTGNASSGELPGCVALSADGVLVAFESFASTLTTGDNNGAADVFVRNRSTGVTERDSVDSTGGMGNGWSAVNGLAISADGRIVAFDSQASNLVAGDTNGVADVFVHDRSTGATERVSVDSSGVQGDQRSARCALSADGNVVAFDSDADNLVAGDTNTVTDVFVRDRAAGTTERASVSSGGTGGDTDSFAATISGDGDTVAFESFAQNLVAGDTNHFEDTFIRRRSAATTVRVSVSATGAQGDGFSYRAAISADAQVVSFISAATDLVLGDTNGFYDVLLRSLAVAAWTNYGAGFPGTLGVPAFTARQAPVLGTTETLDLGNSLGSATTALLLLGFADASIPTGAGGTLLVNVFLTSPLPLPAAGLPIAGALPNDPALWDFDLFLQALEADPGAAHKISFTRGLELTLGY